MTSEHLELGLTDPEITNADLPDCRISEDWCNEHDRVSGDCYDRAIADTATAQAALFFRNGEDADDCWCPEPEGGHTPWPDAGHSIRCMAVQEFLEATGIPKSEGE